MIVSSKHANNLPLDGDYIFLKPQTIEGISYKDGEHLPADHCLREMPRRLHLLVEQRHLSLNLGARAMGTTPVPAPTAKAKAVAVAAVAEVEETEDEPRATLPPDFDDWDLEQLRDKCHQQKLSPIGNKAHLRKRLRAKLG